MPHGSPQHQLFCTHSVECHLDERIVAHDPDGQHHTLPEGIVAHALTRCQLHQPAGGLMQLAPGESVRHDAFGQGMVLSVRVMGNDALIEVAFDTVGTKKLMLRAAMGHLTKE